MSDYPTVTPAPGAETLHRAHCERRPDKAPLRKKKATFPVDHELRKNERELVRFLNECEAAGRVRRYYAADTPGRIVLVLAGPGGVFDPIAPVEIATSTVTALAGMIAAGTAWETFTSEEIAA